MKAKIKQDTARIIGQNHSVIVYELNGHRQYVIEDIPINANRLLVNNVVEVVGRRWEDVMNFIEERLEYPICPNLERCIDSMTY